jgi:hypothetical protein
MPIIMSFGHRERVVSLPQLVVEQLVELTVEEKGNKDQNSIHHTEQQTEGTRGQHLQGTFPGSFWPL